MIIPILGEITHAVAARALAAIGRAEPGEELTILVDSNGGDTGSAFRIAETVHRHAGKTTARVNRRADSAAVLVVAAAQTRVAPADAVFRMHETSAPVTQSNATGLRARAQQLEQLDVLFRQRISAYTGIDISALAALEKCGVTLTAREALNVGLINVLAGCPHLTATAKRQREARAAMRAPIKWTARDFSQLRAMGLKPGRPIGVGVHQLRAMLAGGR